MRDAVEAYKHYLLDNNGAQLDIRYYAFLSDDPSGKTVAKSAVDDARTAILDIFDAKPAAAKVGTVRLRATSGVMTVGGGINVRYPYPGTQNWQKKIGGHALWLSANATITSNPPGPRSVSIDLTFHAEDMYNFDPGKSDVASGIADEPNGRFQVVGLATEFLQKGETTRTITFTVPDAAQPDNRVVPGDQQVN